MERIRGARRAAVVAIGVAALTAATVVTAQAAPATTPTTPTATPNVSSLRTLVRSGQLLKTHDARDICAATHLACQAQVVTTARGSATPLSTSAPVGYGPAELAAAYHLPGPGAGTKGTIAILDAGAYPNLESDLATYRAQYGLPQCTTANGCLKIADYRGGPPLKPGTSNLDKEIEEAVAVETSLDVDMASSACPSCNIVELQLPDEDAIGDTNTDPQTTDFGTAVNTAAALGANAISMSYQYPSDAYEETGTPGRDLFHPGVAVLASSGDGGFEGGQHMGWPQNLPWVTSVGGTSLYAQNAQGTAFTETAWSGAGSGCETDLPGAVGAPSSVSALCGGHRAASDVSAVADPATGVAVYDTYAPYSGQPYDWITVGGTSASSPFIAGLYARGGHLSQVIGPNTLYAAKPGSFSDVKVGQNAPFNTCQSQSVPVALCDSGSGWDGPTGLGSPNGLGGF